MTEYMSRPAVQIPSTIVPRPPANKRWFTRPVIVLPVACLILGFGLGSTQRPDPVVQTVEVPVEKIVTKTVTKTPASCLTALDLAEQGFSYSAEALGYTGEALKAASKLDAAAIYASKDKMDILNPKISALTTKLNAAKAECRAAK